MDLVLPSDIERIAANLGETAQAFSGKRVLLAGGMGFLGHYFIRTFAHLSEKVLEAPVEVRVLDNLITAGTDSNLEHLDGITFERHDIIEPYAAKEHFDFIIHAAGDSSVDRGGDL